MDLETLGRRIRAARELAGLRSVEALAAEIDQSGLGAKTLRLIEQGVKVPAQRDLDAIADACGVGRDWFTAPPEAVRRLAPGDETNAVLQRVLQRLDEMEESRQRDSAVLAKVLGEYLLGLHNHERRDALRALADVAGDAADDSRPARSPRGRSARRGG